MVSATPVVTSEVVTEAAPEQPEQQVTETTPATSHADQTDRCQAFFKCAHFCCDNVRRIEIPTVGMMCFDESGHYPGVITKVVIDETDQAYVHYRDFFTGKVCMQYFDDLVLPPAEYQSVFQIAPADTEQAQRLSGNPFLDMRREFKAFIENRFLPAYHRLNHANEKIEEIESTVEVMLFHFDGNISHWENESTEGRLKPAENNLPSCFLPMADLGGDPFYQLYCKLDRIEHELGEAWDKFKKKVDIESFRYIFACEGALMIAKNSVLELSQYYVCQSNDGSLVYKTPHKVHPLELVAEKLVAIGEIIEREAPAAEKLIDAACDELDAIVMKEIKEEDQKRAKSCKEKTESVGKKMKK